MVEDKKIDQLTQFAQVSDTNAAAKVALSFDRGDYSASLLQIAEYTKLKTKSTQILSRVNIVYDSGLRKLTITEADANAIIYYNIAGVLYSTPSPATVTADPITDEVEFDTYYLGIDGLKVEKSQTEINLDPDRIVIKIISAIEESLWLVSSTSEGDFAKLRNPEVLRLSKTIQHAQTSDQESLNYFTLPSTGNYIAMSDSNNELQLISEIDQDSNFIQGGSEYLIDVKAGQVIKHLFEGDGFFKSIRLDSGQDWTASQDALVRIVYDEFVGLWKVLGTATGDTLAKKEIIAKGLQSGYELMTGGVLRNFTYNELSGAEIFVWGDGINDAVATIDGDNIELTTGKLYGMRVSDAGGTDIAEIVFCGGNTNIKFVYDVINGRQFYLTNTFTVEYQSSYLKALQNGFEEREFIESGDKIFVPLKNDGNPIDL